MKSRKKTEDQLAVSETVGFVIIAGLIFMSIGLVFANGFPILEDTQESEHISNTEKTFNTLQGNVNEVVEREVPRRATEIRLFESSISFGATARMNVTNETEPEAEDWDLTRDNTYIRGSDSLVYEHKGEKIVYEKGAIIRASRAADGSAMIRDPGWTIRENPDNGLDIIIPVVRIDGSGSLSGDGAILVRKEATSISGRDLVPRVNIQEDEEFSIRIRSEYADAWQSYFDSLETVDDDINATRIDENRAQIEFEDLELDDEDRLIYNDNLLSGGLSQ